MNKKSEELLLGFGINLLLIGIGIVIYWGIAGVINITNSYSKFVEKVNNIEARTHYLRDRIEFNEPSKWIVVDGSITFNEDNLPRFSSVVLSEPDLKLMNEYIAHKLSGTTTAK